ncbi:MAG: hypothetical protein IPJ98_14825 [Bryobacterales bacterium]|nr:hypothetical protein [Bryobacterales bacterium]
MSVIPARDGPQPVISELVLTGPPLRLRLPGICAYCGAHGAAPLYWEKVVLVTDSEGSASRLVEGIRAPFCPRCRATHEREVKRMSPFLNLLQCFRSEVMIGAVLTGGAALFFGWKLLPVLNDDVWSVAAWVALVAFFGLIALGCLLAAWRATRWRTVPALTSITSSLQWREETAGLFEGDRYRYTIRHPAFYDALLALNQDRVWKPAGTRARRAAVWRKGLYIALGIAAVLVIFWEYFVEFLRHEW